MNTQKTEFAGDTLQSEKYLGLWPETSHSVAQQLHKKSLRLSFLGQNRSNSISSGQRLMVRYAMMERRRSFSSTPERGAIKKLTVKRARR